MNHQNSIPKKRKMALSTEMNQQNATLFLKNEETRIFLIWSSQLFLTFLTYKNLTYHQQTSTFPCLLHFDHPLFSPSRLLRHPSHHHLVTHWLSEFVLEVVHHEKVIEQRKRLKIFDKTGIQDGTRRNLCGPSCLYQELSDILGKEKRGNLGKFCNLSVNVFVGYAP
jgi:hypothetical protein